MISVLIVDDQRLVRAGLRMLCAAAEDMTVAGEASNGVDAVALAAELDPDVILMDLRMPGLDGIGATQQIVKAGRRARILVLTTFDDDDHLYPALAAGAWGFSSRTPNPPSCSVPFGESPRVRWCSLRNFSAALWIER